MNRRLLAIGLDGYEASVGERMMREGRLPALARVMQRSAMVHLDHGAAKRTGLAWEHFSTGLKPAGANRWSAVEFDPLTYQCSQMGTALRPFPDLLGIKTVVFDPPYFDLRRAPTVQGLVSWGAHDPGTQMQANPAGLLEEIRDNFGTYPATQWIYGFTWPSPDETKRMGMALAEAVRVRARIARWLLCERIRDWSLGIVVASELHSASEALWHGIDERHPLHLEPSAEQARLGLEQTYTAIDELVATLVSNCPDAAVLIFSMHGMGPNESDVASMVLLPELLYRAQFNRPLLQLPDNAALIDEGWSEHVRRYFPRRQNHSALSRSAGSLRRRIPEPLKRLVKRAIRRRPMPIKSSLDWMPANWYAHFWAEMDAFALPSFYDGQVRINLQGRERHGRVTLANYVATCDRIAHELHACVDPESGKSVVREIIRTHRKSPHELGPSEADLVVVWNGAQRSFEHPRFGTIGPCPYRRPGGHTGHHGIAMFSDADTVAGFYGHRSAFDVVPTIAEYLVGSTRPELSGTSFLSTLRQPAQGTERRDGDEASASASRESISARLGT